MVARNELNLAALEQPAGVSLVVGPLLKEHGTDAGALHGIGHVAVLDRRTGVQDNLAVDLGDEVLGRTDVHQEGLRGAEALDNAVVLPIDLVMLGELGQKVNHALVAACHGLPGILDGLGAVLDQRVDEALDADVDNAWLGGEQLHHGLGRLGQRSVILDGVVDSRTVGLGVVDALEGKRGTNGAGVARLHDGAGIGQQLNGAIVILRIVAGAHDGAHKVELATVGAGGLDALCDDRSKLGSHIGVAAIAEHAVEDDNTRGGLGSVLAHHLDADLGVDHGVRTALGVHVVAQVDDVVAAVAQHIAVFLDNVAELKRLGDHHRGLAGKGATGVQTHDGLILGEGLGDRNVDGLAIVGLDLATGSQIHGDLSALLQGVGQVHVAQMGLGLLANEDGDNRLLALLEQVDDLVANLGRRRLGDNADNVGGVMVLERHDSVLNGNGADLGVKVAATGTDGMHAAATHTVDGAGDFLDAGARSADDADVAGVNHVGEGHGHGADHAGAAVGTHKEQALLVRLLL